MPISLLFILCFLTNLQAYTLETFFGPLEIQEPVLQELLECPSIKRLKDIHQYGTEFFNNFTPYPYSRYEHSCGVLWILKTYEACLEEQIAGLLHDVSHTVFSHVGDHLIKSRSWIESYQDDIFLWYIHNTEIVSILEKHGFNPATISPKNGCFSCLEQELPTLCADRIEYILHGAFLEHQITLPQIHYLLKTLRFENNQWFFTQLASAQTMAQLSIYLTQHLFACPQNWYIYSRTAKMLRRAVKIGLLAQEEIHFSTDTKVWQKLLQTEDPKIKNHLHKMLHYDIYLQEHVTQQEGDIRICPKCRVVDPLVLNNDNVTPLSSLDHTFHAFYVTYKEQLRNGFFVAIS